MDKINKKIFSLKLFLHLSFTFPLSLSLSLSLTHTHTVKLVISPGKWMMIVSFDTWRGIGRDTWECLVVDIIYIGKIREYRDMVWGITWLRYVKWKAKQVSKIQEIKDVMQIWRLLWISQIFLKIQEYRTPYGGWSALKDTLQIYAVRYLISFVFLFPLCFSSFHYITSIHLFFFFLL